jgi:hypothetical protein
MIRSVGSMLLVLTMLVGAPSDGLAASSEQSCVSHSVAGRFKEREQRGRLQIEFKREQRVSLRELKEEAEAYRW